MCGICGAVGDGDASVLAEMAACLAHRGPDDTGTHVTDDVMLANQRLSIIDIEGGDQPVYNEDGDVVVVYNGEIYNFRSLRADLEAAGHRFTSETDTEVLVHGYEEYGLDVFSKLNGMFAVALWDATDERLLLARDRVGVKPLYYARTDGGVTFASEPKSILRSGRVRPAVDERALQYFLQLRYSPSHTTLFEGIETLLPGQILEIGRDGDGWTATEHQYWTPTDAGGDPPADPVGAVEDALRNAVERQLMSDVPVGFYLSGGLDTSSVVAMADEVSDDPIHTFCMGFEDQAWDERADARTVADHFGTNHHEITVEREFMRDFPEMIWHADEPKRNLYPYYVAREMSDHVSVALGGLGADELFGGYVYRYSRLRELDQLRSGMPGTENAAVADTAGQVADWQLAYGDLDGDDVLEDVGVLRHVDDPARLYVLLNSTDVFGDIEAVDHRVLGDAFGEFVPADWVRARLPGTDDLSLTERALYWDFAVKLPDDFLLVEDRMSMAHSLESRVPFLDNELVDVAFSLPQSEKFGAVDDDRDVGKSVLRRAMRDRLPDAVFEKDKQGFTMPTYPFARDEMLPHARRILADPHVVREGYVQASYLDELLGAEPRRELTPHYKMLWKLVALEIWYQMYIVDGVGGPEPLDSYYT
ncbi:asparagine synthase (glutamine-hydrolyzing) [Halosimplex marinum]|uniref:asparagine synthase (glutamine-hydrolyzing) n=1 Tax=Halosimplex marinum TaxID=3396620 RepID=UPI003F56F3D9